MSYIQYRLYRWKYGILNEHIEFFILNSQYVLLSLLTKQQQNSDNHWWKFCLSVRETSWNLKSSLSIFIELYELILVSDCLYWFTDLPLRFGNCAI